MSFLFKTNLEIGNIEEAISYNSSELLNKKFK